MKLIVGLGNPGITYKHTQHNVGFLALDALAKKLNLSWSHDTKQNADIAKVLNDGIRIVLAKPQTFMNRSGDAVRKLASTTKVKPENMLIVHDDMDFVPGRMAFKRGGSSAGHKGLASVIEGLKTENFTRLRIGIGHPTTQSTEDWVLGKISAKTLQALQCAPEAILDWAAQGLAQAMTKWNVRSS